MRRARDHDIDLLDPSAAPVGASLPAGWQTRAVRGKQLPMSRIIDSSGSLFTRLSEAGHAGWLAHELTEPLFASVGHLAWPWRAMLAPAVADGRGTDHAGVVAPNNRGSRSRRLGPSEHIFGTEP